MDMGYIMWVFFTSAVILILETLRSRFGDLTTNGLTVSSYPSAHVWDLRFAGKVISQK